MYDEPGIVRLIERFAEKIGFEVTTAGNGGEALEKLERLGLLDVDFLQ